MTPQERQLIDDLFDRLAKLENAPRDPEAMSRDHARLAQGAQRRLRAGADRAGAGRSAEARQRPHPGIGSRRKRASKINPAASSIRCATRSSGRTSRAARCRMCAPPDMGSRPVWNSGQVLQQSQSGRAIQSGLRPAASTASPTGAPQAAVRRRWRFVPRNRGGGRRRRGRWIAAAQQHPLDDGRRQPSGLRRYRGHRRRQPKASSRGAISPAATWRATPASTTSARPASAPTTIRVRAQDCSTRRRTMTIMTTWITIPTALTTTAEATATTPERIPAH